MGVNFCQPSPDPFLKEGKFKGLCGDTPPPGSIRMLHLRLRSYLREFKGYDRI
jgi:hypothetical protein